MKFFEGMKLAGIVLLSIITYVIISSYITINTSPKSNLIDNKPVENNSVDTEYIVCHSLFKANLNKALQQYFKKSIDAGAIVGAGVSIVYGDSILFSDGFGKRAVKENTKIDGETVFRLGSLSKGFAGVLMSSLQEEGKLDWEDKVVEHLPNFQFGDSIHTRNIKLSHLLSHTTGTPYHSYTNLVEAGIPVEKITEYFKDLKPISSPGTMYSYQNAMFSLSQEVVKKVTGQEVNTLLENKFFEPLGMNTVSMKHTDLVGTENVALPHLIKNKGWRSLPLTDKYYNAVVAGGINASALDMAKWMRFLLGHHPEVLQPKTIEQVFKPFIEINNNNKYYQRWPNHVKSHYGFGWRIHSFKNKETQDEKTMWHHGGSVNNYRNEIALYPQDDLGICVLFNGNYRLARTVIPDVYAIVSEVYNQIYL